MNILYFKKLDSTNIKAKQISNLNTVVVAEQQLKGKGRFKRKWSSEKGGLYFSITTSFKDQPQFLTFIAALSVFKSIKKLYNVKTTIKWPNDIIYKNKKLCGILTENIFGDQRLSIIGIGVNTNNKVPLILKNKAASLTDILKKNIDNKRLLSQILKNFDIYLKKDKGDIITEWKKNSFLGEKVKVRTIDKTFEGTAFNLDKEGFLIIKTKDNHITIKEGDIFLKH